MLKILVFSFLLSGSNCREAYLNEVFSSKSWDGYFIVIKAKIGGKERDISIANVRLYDVLKMHDTALNDLDRYKQFMKEKIYKGEPVNLTKEDVDKMGEGLGFISSDVEVARLASDGINEVFKKYFWVSPTGKFAVMNQNIPSESIGAIMKVLFENNYLMSNADGKFGIEDMNFCQDASNKN